MTEATVRRHVAEAEEGSNFYKSSHEMRIACSARAMQHATQCVWRASGVISGVDSLAVESERPEGLLARWLFGM